MNIIKKAEMCRKNFKLVNLNGKDKWINEDLNNSYVVDMCHNAHGEMFPDDFKYNQIVNCLDFIIENNINREDLFQDLLSEVDSDIYTSDLTDWLNSNNSRVYYLTEALESFDCKDGFQALSIAQKIEIEEIYNSVFSYLRENEI